MLSMTLWLLTVLVPLQILLGDLHGLNTLEHQPAKLAAIEAHWETATARAADAVRHSRPGRPRPTASRSTMPLLGSLILTHDARRRGQGLKDLPAARTGRRSRSPSSPSASWSASAC